MKKIFILFFLLFWVAAGCAPYFTQHFKDSLFAVAENQKFSVEIVTDNKDLKVGKDSIGIIVHDSNDEDVEHADISVTAVMQEKDRKQSLVYAVTDKSGGFYTIESLDIKQSGIRQLKVKIKKDGVEDVAVFYFGDNK